MSNNGDESDSDDEVPILLNVDEIAAGDDLDGGEINISQTQKSNNKKTTTDRIIDKVDVVDIDCASSLPPCPVTILSGFLGSGKTTLIQYILQSPDHGKRIAVIENEFGGGNQGISVENIIARDGANQESLADLIELPNGCICCTVKDSLIETLENLLTKRSDLDYILIEASGMANPGPIASLFWLDDALESRLRLDGVVTLVDALNLEQQLEQTEEAAQQIAYADRILLNKVDLVGEHKIENVLQKIRAIQPMAPVRTTTYSKIPDLEWILDANCFDVDRAKEVDLALSQIVSSSSLAAAATHGGECTDAQCQQCAVRAVNIVPDHILGESNTILNKRPNAHKHTSAVGTVPLFQNGSVDLIRMNSWIASLLWPNQDEQNSILKARLEESLQKGELEETEKASGPSKEASKEMQIFRIKGILSVRHQNEVQAEDIAFVDESGLDTRRYILQAVHDLWEIHPASEDLRWDRSIDDDAETASERSTKIVVIGKNLPETELNEGFRSCFADIPN